MFRYKTESPAADYVELMAESMHLYEPQYYIAGGELYFEYKPELITEVLDNLTADRVNIIIHSKTKGDDFYNKVEPWFQTPYRVEGKILTQSVAYRELCKGEGCEKIFTGKF